MQPAEMSAVRTSVRDNDAFRWGLKFPLATWLLR